MDEREKLKILLHYWMKHNKQHAKLYMDWAVKISSAGNEELSRILVRLCMKQKSLNRLFDEAIKKIS